MVKKLPHRDLEVKDEKGSTGRSQQRGNDDLNRTFGFNWYQVTQNREH